MEPKIIFENENFIAVNKPAGLLIHGVKGVKNSGLTLVDWLLKKCPKIKSVGDNPEIRPGIVHRLDKDTSGVVLIAKNQKYFEYLKNLFQNHKIQKTYIALVSGKLKEHKGIIDKPISLKPGTTKRTVFRGKMTKEAITEYEVLKIFELPQNFSLNSRQPVFFSLLKVWPKTGRTHQIRIHLSSIGHPIVGDSLYGHKENALGLKRQFLHAESVEFNVDETNKMKIEAELPKDLKNILKRLT
ncbi:MAG: RluA family pseudouridine synthase [Patescibacteria group bacterium]|nr:RluA family pseudouridine synthase [Patescibacteria group bacterium]